MSEVKIIQFAPGVSLTQAYLPGDKVRIEGTVAKWDGTSGTLTLADPPRQFEDGALYMTTSGTVYEYDKSRDRFKHARYSSNPLWLQMGVQRPTLRKVTIAE